MNYKNIIAGLILSAGLLLTGCKKENPQNTEIAQGTMLSNDKNLSSSVFITEDENGIPVVSWIESADDETMKMYFSKWDSNADGFNVIQEIPVPQNISTHEEGMPKIAFKNDGTMMTIFEQKTPVEGTRWGITDLMYILSKDGGQSWSEPKSVSKEENKSPSRSFSGISRLGDGEIGVAWLDNDPDPEIINRKVMFAKTNGDDFENPILIDPKACECCRVSVSADDKNGVTLAYRNLLEGEIRDISLVTSEDSGKTFTQPVNFSGDNWSVNGCPHNGPSSVTTENKIYSSWFTDGNEPGVHFAEMDLNGKILQKILLSSDAKFSQMIQTQKGDKVVVFDETYEVGDEVFSRIQLAEINDNGISKMSITPVGMQAMFPVLETLNDGNIVVAWRDGNRIFYKKVVIS